MSWIFGDIDFSVYGVMVSKSTGVLDLPSLKNEGYDWLDENGLDYWQDSPKYNDRFIVLNCWMVAEKSGLTSGYEAFRTKVQAFTEAVKAAGKVSFETPYITINDCSISDGVSIIRETNYVQDIQAGTFSLRIIVHGDSDYDLLTIYDKSSSAVKEIVKTKNLTINKTLQGEEYATCTVETNQPLISGMYEYIRINTDGIGIGNDFFILPSVPSARKDSTNKFVYDLRFEGITLHFRQMKFLFDGLAEFDYYGNLEDVVGLVCSNVNRFIWFADRFSIWSCEATEKRLHNFSGEDCLSVLQRICSEYKMEYRFERQPDTTYKIYVSEFANKANSVVLEYGKGNSLYQITRGAADTSKLCTVLWAYGAAKNLKADYRGGKKRLTFDGNPLRVNENIYGTWEHTENFDEIFPNRTATVTGYLQVLPEDLTDAEKEVYPEGIFVVGDSTLDFDLNAYLSGGLTAKIAMKTGNLAGYQFDIRRYDNLTKLIHIIRYKDEVGGLLPNDVLMIEPGDEYTLIDMNQPSSYVATAEAELLAAAQAYINKWSVPAHEYQVRTNPAFLQANPGTGFNVGDVMTIQDTDLGIDVENRVTSLTYSLRNKTFDMTLAVFKKLPKRLDTEFRLQTIERSMLLTKKDTGEVIRDDKQPTDEAKRKLLDPDDKLRVDDIVRSSSIDPRMLGLDSGTLQWSLKNALVECNVDNNEDKVRIGAGTITIHNWGALNRYEIYRKKQLAETYDPTRTWNIALTNFTLATKNPYWIYAKLNLTESPSVSTECVIEIDEQHKEGKLLIEDNYLYIKIGGISAGEEV